MYVYNIMRARIRCMNTIFLRAEEFKTRQHVFKVRGERFGTLGGNIFHSGYVEHAAR